MDKDNTLSIVQHEQQRLLNIEAAAQLLYEASSISEVAEIRNYAEAVRLVAKQAKAGLDVQNKAAALKLRAERRAGEMLAQVERQSGERTDLTSSQSVTRLKETTDAVGIDRMTAHRWQKIASIPERAFEQRLADVQAQGQELTTSGMVQFASTGKAHVAYNSGDNEWYTPPAIIEVATRLMGAIDTDPASSAIANQWIQAATYYTIDTDGLQHSWYGNVWMNPPYAQPLITHFCDKLQSERAAGHIQQACVLVNNATETAWFQTLLQTVTAICLIRGRVKFLDSQMQPGAPLQGQALLYYGHRREDFAALFAPFGAVLHG